MLKIGTGLTLGHIRTLDGNDSNLFFVNILKSHIRISNNNDYEILNFYNYIIEIRLRLAGAIHNENYRLGAKCPNHSGEINPLYCGRNLSNIEIIRGFSNKENDYTTKCPDCGDRFEPTIVVGNENLVEMSLHCEEETLNELKNKEFMSPQELQNNYRSLYRAIVIHYGSLNNAFYKLGINYKFYEFKGWEEKVMPFLGRLPDIIIASAIGVCEEDIINIREINNITRYSKAKILKELKKLP